ncbi:MAG: hypothetical protein N2442_06340 [Spirochaetes bacterium]|nr:hypothetical protein [Spirochaetota bacterium]
MNEILSNLFVLIPLAFLIALRILQSRAQRKAGVQTKPVSYPKRVLQGERSIAGITLGQREKRSMYPMAQEVTTEFKEGEFVSGEEEHSPPVPTGVRIPEGPTSAEEKRQLPSLPEKITKLSPWKQAVVIREILGPPKGW